MGGICFDGRRGQKYSWNRGDASHAPHHYGKPHCSIVVFIYINKKSHTCEEGAAHLKISFWHLLVNLENKYLLKNCWSFPVKNKTVLIFTMLHFCCCCCWKNKEKHLEISFPYTCVLKIYHSWDKAWKTEVDNLRSFFALLTTLPSQKRRTSLQKRPKKLKIWKNENISGDTIILLMCTKNNNYMMFSSWDTEWDTTKFFFDPFFDFFTPRP